MRNKPTKSLNAGAAVSSGVKTGLVGVKDGALFVAKNAGSGARGFASIVADFGRGLKKGWQKA